MSNIQEEASCRMQNLLPFKPFQLRPEGSHDFPLSARERAYKFVDQYLRP